VRNTDIDRIKQESAHLEAMGGLGSPTTPSGSPLLERLLQLEQHVISFSSSSFFLLVVLNRCTNRVFKKDPVIRATTFTSLLYEDAYAHGQRNNAGDVLSSSRPVSHED
jgi:hypothetical protein